MANENISFLPEQRWNSPDWRQVVLVDVVEDFVVERDQVLQLRLGDSGLGGGDVGQRVRYLGSIR